MSFSITRVYTGDDGETHFDDVTVEIDEETPLGMLSKLVPGHGVIFRTTAAGQSLDWHNAPRRQYVVMLRGPAAEIEVSDGEVRRIEPGNVILVEDTTGPGHITRTTDDSRERVTLFLPLE